MWKGIGLIGLGTFTIIWYILKIISCIMIAGLISTRIGLNNYYWWFSSIIIFSILLKIVFMGNNIDNYIQLVDDYKKDTNCKNIDYKITEDNKENE